ncbi:hypothetical protein [Chitinophaga sp.]|uniref:hypothetical protein n=1 Tax=Chitinophaga sp. TaxID=1869181 RepID=UPI0031E1CECF
MTLIEQFENCTLPKEEWTHENHFVMAFWYCIKYPLPEAVQRISNGIRQYNESVGGQNTADTGYHETITLFYTSVIADYVITHKINTFTADIVADFLQQPFLNKQFITRFYSEAYLMSKEARLQWQAPDKS